MLIRAVPRRLVSLGVAGVTTLAVVTLFSVQSASASGPTEGTQVSNSALPTGAVALPSPFSSGQRIDVQIPANSSLQPGLAVNILECSDPGGLPANDPTSISDCDGNTIQGPTVQANSDGSVDYSGYTVYALPDLIDLGEPSTQTPVCNATNYCVLYIGQDQNNFAQPYFLSQPFLVTPNATDNGANPGNGEPTGTPLYDGVGVATSTTVTVPGAPNGTPAKLKAKKLPSGLSIAANTNGTVTITGSATTGGSYTVSIEEEFVSGKTKTTVTDSVPFIVYQPATFLAAPPSSVSATIGKNVKVKLKTNKKEYPATPTFSVIGALPSGVSLMTNGGEAELTGAPAAGSQGTYPVTIEASNSAGDPPLASGFGAPASVSFTLTVAA